MISVVVITAESGLTEAIRTVLNPQEHQIIPFSDLKDANLLLRRGLADICILDLGEPGDQGALLAVQEFRRLAPECPLIGVTTGHDAQWDEDLHVAGVNRLIDKPLRDQLFLIHFNQALKPDKVQVDSNHEMPPHTPIQPSPTSTLIALQALRKPVQLLGQGLEASELLRQFLALIRESLSVNRAAIFLPAHSNPAATETDTTTTAQELEFACGVGIDPAISHNVRLSSSIGIGRHLFESGGILRKPIRAQGKDQAAIKEFNLIGLSTAIPICHADRVLGALLLDQHLDGSSPTDDELRVVFHLLEDLGHAIGNAWQHRDIAGRHRTKTSILDQIGSICVLFDTKLNVIHANQAAQDFFADKSRRDSKRFVFSHLPQDLGGKVFEAANSGKPQPLFKYRPTFKNDLVFQVRVTPHVIAGANQSKGVLLVMEDCTQYERSMELEIETSNLRLVKTMAEHLAHEINNSLVPISTYQQLFPEHYEEAEFRDSFATAMGDGVRRIQRLTNQLLMLSRDRPIRNEPTPVSTLIEEAFEEAKSYQPGTESKLKYSNGKGKLILNGDQSSLKHALAEVMLNAIQASPKGKTVDVKASPEKDDQGRDWVHIEIADEGDGFSPEAVQRAGEAFFSTRNVGLGLGLAVTRKVIQVHSGVVEFPSNKKKKSGVVRIKLPLESKGQ